MTSSSSIFFCRVAIFRRRSAAMRACSASSSLYRLKRVRSSLRWSMSGVVDGVLQLRGVALYAYVSCGGAGWSVMFSVDRGDGFLVCLEEGGARPSPEWGVWACLPDFGCCGRGSGVWPWFPTAIRRRCSCWFKAGRGRARAWILESTFFLSGQSREVATWSWEPQLRHLTDSQRCPSVRRPSQDWQRFSCVQMSDLWPRP